MTEGPPHLTPHHPPVLPPGRLDRKIEFPHPNEEARAKILQVRALLELYWWKTAACGASGPGRKGMAALLLAQQLPRPTCTVSPPTLQPADPQPQDERQPGCELRRAGAQHG